jgi:hypothetical protein
MKNEFDFKNGSRFVFSFGIDKSNTIQDLIFLGVRWEWELYNKWIEIFIFGFCFYFDLV